MIDYSASQIHQPKAYHRPSFLAFRPRMNRIRIAFFLCVFLLHRQQESGLYYNGGVNGFNVAPTAVSREYPSSWSPANIARQPTWLDATGGKPKRRRRKQAPGSTAPDPIKLDRAAEEGDSLSPTTGDDDDSPEELSADDLLQIEGVAKFEYSPKESLPIPSSDKADPVSSFTPPPVDDQTDGSIPLPDIKDVKRRKEMQRELELMREEEETKVKIKRSDKEAFAKLLEQQPFADADESFFEEEEYGLVSALLGERARKFVGIPTGPLQVGHFIGALGLVLMAFIEYPGFPLTNLPTPLRESLQGGLGTIYAINTLLAVSAAFKAGERGQPKLLWVAKTFSVGGLAYDQLTQLPTLEQIEKAKSRKGARSLKNRKNN